MGHPVYSAIPCEQEKMHNCITKDAKVVYILTMQNAIVNLLLEIINFN